MSERPPIAHRAQVLQRIRAEFLEMPGLRLTAAQAGRLCGLDAPSCGELLDRLSDERFLHRRADGTYARPTDVRPGPPLRAGAASAAAPPLGQAQARRSGRR